MINGTVTVTYTTEINGRAIKVVTGADDSGPTLDAYESDGSYVDHYTWQQIDRQCRAVMTAKMQAAIESLRRWTYGT